LNQEDVVGGIPVEAGLHVEVATEGLGVLDARDGELEAIERVLEMVVVLTTVSVLGLHTG
jgi:hypothetical protein